MPAVKHQHSDALDSPERIHELKATIARKPALRQFMQDVYRRYQDVLSRAPAQGTVLELGSGAGFAKDVIPELVTSDVLPYDGVDKVVDATKLPFADESLRAVFMLNVFHHIPDVAAFLHELERCLVPGGRVLIADQHVGPLSRPIHKYLHHEPFRPDATSWQFDSTGPLSGANGALAWIVFQRDRALFEQNHPKLSLVKYEPHSPLRYWLAGGLKSWTLLPGRAYGLARLGDELITRAHPDLGCFVDVELVKKA